MGATATVELPLREPGDCVACAKRLRERLAAHRGVTAVEPVSGRDAVRVTYDPDLCSLDCLDETTEGLRLDLTSAYRHEVGTIDGMDCADCARTIESAVGRMGGVTNVSVSYPAARLRVEFQPSEVEMDAIVQRITRLGYRVPEHDGAHNARRLALLRSRDGTTAISIALMAAALVVDLATGVSPIPLYAAAILAGGLPLARAGIVAALATRRPDINLLMTIATVGAVAIDAWLEAALVVVLFSIGQLLESRAAERARRELAGLVALTPDTAHVRRRQGSGPFALLEEIELPVAELVVGDVVIVRPGERIPVDARVMEGASAVDQAPITGESVPVDKAPGDAVFAGTLNGQGLLALATNAAPGDSTLDRIGALVAEAQARKSPSERWVDSFARWYTPAVVGVAASVALLPPIFGVAWSTSVYDALALLILACPCALVISTPVAIVSALARASAAGVLVKGGAHLEQAAAIRAVAFDKTGTLTLGRPRVDEIIATEGNERDILALVAALESGSEHPLARAIVAAAHERGLTVATPDTFEALPGLGARGTVAGRDVEVGDTRLFPTLPKTLAHQLARLRERGCTAVVVALDGRPVGAIGISDTLRPEATDAISDLRRLGIDQIVLLTGDNAVTAAAVAARVGIHDVRAGLMPHDKATAADTIDSLAMVGDGVNDAPALARASLGIAMGTAGSDTAIEVADVAIMGDDPRKVAGLIGLGRWTRSIVRQNIGFSLGTKLLAAAILAAGALPLWGAVVTDVGASLIVTANGLRLVRGHPIGTRRALPLLPGRSRHATPAARPAPACHIDHDH